MRPVSIDAALLEHLLTLAHARALDLQLEEVRLRLAARAGEPLAHAALDASTTAARAARDAVFAGLDLLKGAA